MIRDCKWEFYELLSRPFHCFACLLWPLKFLPDAGLNQLFISFQLRYSLFRWLSLGECLKPLLSSWSTYTRCMTSECSIVFFGVNNSFPIARKFKRSCSCSGVAILPLKALINPRSLSCMARSVLVSASLICVWMFCSRLMSSGTVENIYLIVGSLLYSFWNIARFRFSSAFILHDVKQLIY